MSRWSICAHLGCDVASTLMAVVSTLQRGAELDLANAENTLGFHLDLAVQYADAVKVSSHTYCHLCLPVVPI